MFAKLILATVVCFVLTSCSKVKTFNPTEIKHTEVLFFKSPPPKKGQRMIYPSSSIQGYLVQKGNCLYISLKQNSDQYVYGIIWPWNYTKDIENNKLVIKNGSNIKIATINSYIKLGGGAVIDELGKVYNQCSKFKPIDVFGGHSLLKLN